MSYIDSSLFDLDIRRFPADLVIILVLLFLTDISILVPAVRATPLRVPFGFLILLFLPGYVFTAAIFPEHGYEDGVSAESKTASASDSRQIDGVERVTLSIALSLVIVMVIALTLHHTQVGVRLLPALVALNIFIVIVTGIAAVRRLRLPPERRLRIPLRTWFAEIRADVHSFDRVDRILSVVLVALILVTIGATGYTVIVPGEDDKFTEFYLLTETETGTLVATDYPTEFSEGEGKRLFVGIRNHEYQTVDYTVVVELQRVNHRSSSAAVIDERELHRFDATVQHNATWRKSHLITPKRTGQNFRLVYLLYRGEPPAEPTRNNAYRELHLWINVSENDVPADNLLTPYHNDFSTVKTESSRKTRTSAM